MIFIHSFIIGRSNLRVFISVSMTDNCFYNSFEFIYFACVLKAVFSTLQNFADSVNPTTESASALLKMNGSQVVRRLDLYPHGHYTFIIEIYQ